MKWIGKREFFDTDFGESEEIIVIEKVNENHPYLKPTYVINEHFQQQKDGTLIRGKAINWGMNGVSSATLSGIKRLVNQDTGHKNKDWIWVVGN